MSAAENYQSKASSFDNTDDNNMLIDKNQFLVFGETEVSGSYPY